MSPQGTTRKKSDHSRQDEEAHDISAEVEQLVHERTADLQKENEALRSENANLKQSDRERKEAERSLRESQKKYQALIETNVDFIWEMDSRGRYTYCSPQMEKLWGLKPEDMIGKTPFDMMPPQVRERALQEFMRVSNASDRFSGLVTIAYDGQGHLIFVGTSGIPFFDDNGALLGYRGITRDITERKRAEEALRKANAQLDDRVKERTAELQRSRDKLETEITERKRAEDVLRESEERYRTLIELSPGPIAVHHEGNVVYANPACVAMAGARAPQDLIGKPILRFVHSDDHDIVRERVCQMLARGETVPLKDERFLTLNGQEIHVSVVATPITYENLPAVMVLFQDITERKQAEDALRKSEEEYRLLINTLQEGVVVIDSAGVITYANPPLAAMLGYTMEETVGKSVFSFMDRRNAQILRDNMENRQEGVKNQYELEAITEQGVKKHVLIEASPLTDEQGIFIGSIAGVMDITERKRAEVALKEYAERLKRSNEDLERFAYISSHDLQEPLRTLVTFTQLLERRYQGKLDPDADEYLHYIVSAGNRMQTLINDLLNYSRVTTRGGPPTETDSQAVLEHALQDLTSTIGMSGAAITYDPLPKVLADPSQLQQVFSNLISNAIKFRREEPPRV
ncbi:MAG: PAS domain S-box protein, partial [Methanobacteriota archaeon]